MTTETTAPPIVPYVKTDAQGPFLQGSRCRACGHTFVGERKTCAKCAARDQMETVRLAETGKVYVSTIVYRSFPGVQTPFIDVIVDLDDGAHIKGVLKGVEPDPTRPIFDLPVRVVYSEETPVNRPGEKFLTYAFAPL